MSGRHDDGHSIATAVQARVRNDAGELVAPERINADFCDEDDEDAAEAEPSRARHRTWCGLPWGRAIPTAPLVS